MNPQKSQTAPAPSFLSKVGDFVSDALSSKMEYKAPAPVKVPTPVPVAKPQVQPQPKSNFTAPPNHFKEGIKTAYKLYPEIPKGLIEAVLLQESGMGKLDTNKTRDAGEWGWIGGITKTGIYADMLKNQNIHYAAKDVPGALNLSTPQGAIAMMGSILAQKIRQNYKGKLDPEKAIELYDKYYKTHLGYKLSDTQKKHFMDSFKYYSET